MAAKRTASPAAGRRPTTVADVLEWLERHGTKAVRDGMARYGIPSDTAFGVAVGALRQRAQAIGRDHALAAALWETDRYEARMLTAFLGDPEQLSAAQMERWTRQFDNWAICDTLCFHLYDRSPHAFGKIEAWSKRRAEFTKRAAFALLASVALHDREADDAAFLRLLPLVERGAEDERNFVKKGVSWALRSLGCRSLALNQAALALSQRLARADAAAPRWIGKDVVRDLARPSALRRLAARERARRAR